MSDPATFIKANILSSLQRLSRRIENIERQLQDERHSLEKLIDELSLLKITEATPFGEVVAATTTVQCPRVDRRSLPNPEKNLKISARRSLAWSYGMSPEKAHARVMSAVERRAKVLGFSSVPASVVEYVDAIGRQHESHGKKRNGAGGAQ